MLQVDIPCPNRLTPGNHVSFGKSKSYTQLTGLSMRLVESGAAMPKVDRAWCKSSIDRRICDTL
ncbi:hypothetical protein IQ270_00770 [Microcoleus sp. LEGE 07076]|nr:hypothetical protein [Microcoleus sp. LEGE 07076]